MKCGERLMKTRKIDKKTVHYVAGLARLRLSDAEIEGFSEQLSAIVGFIDNLNRVKTDNVEPTSHAVSNISNVFREDAVTDSLPADAVLTNAPCRIGDFFGVPKIIEQDNSH